MIQAPKFWQYTPGWQACLLWPFSKIYQGLYKLRRAKSAQKSLPIPIICIGNLTLGGAGKTPTALAIAQILQQQKIQVSFISRGYGRKTRDTRHVNPEEDTAETVGDEPLLLAQIAPTWVTEDRSKAIALAHAYGTQIAILDDGLQNSSIHKDVSILVVDGRLGFGNGFLFPAGPLRVPLKEGLKNIDAILIIEPLSKDLEPLLKKHTKVSLFKAKPVLEIPQNIKRKKGIAFAGIAYPHKFFEGLRAQGIEIIKSYSFGDHAFLSDQQFQDLVNQAHQQDAVLLTTHKDFVRLDPTRRTLVTSIPYHLKLEDSFIKFMEQKANDLVYKTPS